MRIGFTSDFHLGFGVGKRRDEAVKQAIRAMQTLKKQKVDLIINTGDVFDTVVPRPEALRDAAQVFATCPIRAPLQGINRPDSSVGVLALHGNHERRIKGEVNPVELLEHLGLVTYLHNSGVVADGAEFFGVGSVPETYAPKVFQQMKIRPTTDQPSFFLFHQNLRPYVPTKDSLDFSDLPAGFNYYVNGHIHTPRLEKNLLITGSTVMTSLTKAEAEKKVWVWEDGQFESFTFPTRPFIHIDITADGQTPLQLVKRVNAAVEEALTAKALADFDESPLVRVVVRGKMAPGCRPGELVLRSLPEFGDAAVYFDKKLDTEGLTGEAGLETINISELTTDAFREVLKTRQPDLDPSILYDLLMREDWEGVWHVLTREVTKS
ncbi:MAG TPA: hypothetical protein ENN60_01105 [archaeon]|nr:hypothetical protein [archaeon]